MTNVPEPIRNAWKDLYILFDRHYSMDGSEEQWEKYWLEAMELIKKHDGIPLLDLIEATAKQIEAFVKQRNEQNKSVDELFREVFRW